jgi:hypothetical protein
MYGYHLNQVAHELEMDLWMEHPAQINPTCRFWGVSS